MINPMDLSGKHILIAGASSGIGEEIAIHVTRLGAKVSLFARSEDKLQKVVEKLEDKRGKYFLLDLSKPDKIEAKLEEVFLVQGRFDGVVYCAGSGDSVPLKMTKPEILLKTANLNYFSFVEFVRCSTVKRYRGEKMSIVGISSIKSKRGDKSLTMYSSTKAAMNGAMYSMAHELAPYHIRINNVLPGWVKTELSQNAVGGLDSASITNDIENLQYLGFTEKIDVANAVAFLLSDSAKNITGTELVVAGGYLT